MQAELIEDAGHVPFHGGYRNHQLVRDAVIGAALRDQRQYLPLSRRQGVDRTCPPLAADQARHHVRIEHRPAAGDAADGVGEHAQIADFLLQQVADASSAVRNEIEGVAVLQELGQDQDTCSRTVGTDLKGRPEPVISMVRRHLDVGDDNVRAVHASHLYQAACVIRGADYVESALLQDVHDPFPDEGLILAHDDANPLRLAHVATLFLRRRRCHRSGPPPGSQLPAKSTPPAFAVIRRGRGWAGRGKGTRPAGRRAA